jgi:hypothetical protein
VELLRKRVRFADPLAHESIRLAPRFPLTFARAFARLRALVFVAIACAAAVLGDDLVGPTPAASSVTPTPEAHPAWIDVTRAAGAFAVAMPSLDPAQSSYRVRRHRDGGGRKDLMTFGAAADKGPYVRIEFYRPGSEGEAIADPLAAVAALAADSRIDAELSETPNRLKTKFGELSVIDMNVTGADAQRACIAIARAWDDPRFGLAAWWCNPGPEMVPAGELACLVDRIALMSAGGDERLAAFFAKAELKRNFCGQKGAILTATPRRLDDWMSQKAPPPLRGRIVELRGRIARR